MMLGDNTVVPHFLGLKSTGHRGDPGNQTNITLRWGEVVGMVYPTDPRNYNKKYLEYVVKVVVQDGSGPAAQVYYNGVQLENLFGGVADFLKYTLRPADTTTATTPGQLGMGSKVLLLCISGDTHQAIILGGVRDGTNDDNVDTAAEGHHLEFEFNGLNLAINSDGELAVTFHGATNADGSLADSADTDAQGSTLVMDKAGGITFTSADQLQSVAIDQANSVVTVNADTKLNLICTGQVSVQSSGLVLGAGTNAFMLGSNYRFADQTMNTTLSALATSIQALATTAGAGLTAAGLVISAPYVGGGLAAPGISAAGQALTAMAPLFGAWSASITQFEAQSTKFLSGKNFGD
jgi:hypothetical protein